jgi:hypothetical protein
MSVAVVRIDPDGTPDGYCRALEDGAILLLPDSTIEWRADERAALVQPDAPRGQKNISYRRDRDRLDGAAQNVATLRGAMRRYADHMTSVVGALLPRYAEHWRVDATSYRPVEEAGRRLAWRHRNDLLHVDAFPSRPTNGDRILRAFTNLHPERARRWITADTFDVLAPRLWASGAGRQLSRSRSGSPWQRLRRRILARAPHAARALAPLLERSPYDSCMLRLHDHLKADADFQRTGPHQQWDFLPGSSWILFTDFVPHAALSGQFAVEQTWLVPCSALLQPEKAPVSILERLTGGPLTDPREPSPHSPLESSNAR